MAHGPTGLENHLADLLDHPVREVVDFGIDLTTAAGATLLSSVEFFARELDRPSGLADMPIAREQLETFVMTQLLHTGLLSGTRSCYQAANQLRHHAAGR